MSKLGLPKLPEVGQEAVLDCTLESHFAMKAVSLTIDLPEGVNLVRGSTTWQGDMSVREIMPVYLTIKVTSPGNKSIGATAFCRIDENNRHWKWVQEFARAGAEHFRGRAMVGFPDLIGGLDLLAQLLGNEKLLWALADEGKHVRRLESETSSIFLRYYDPLYQMIKDETGGSSWGCFDTYGAGRMAVVQCDFSGMISAAMFEEYCVPSLAEICERVDQPVYHLDGSCALQHVDALLAIDSLAEIQWTPGTGSLPPATDESWIPLYRRIRAAGKAVMVRGGYARDVPKLVEELGPRGLDIAIYVASQDEAEELVRQSFTWRKA